MPILRRVELALRLQAGELTRTTPAAPLPVVVVAPGLLQQAVEKNVGEAGKTRRKQARKRSVLWYMSIPSLFLTPYCQRR